MTVDVVNLASLFNVDTLLLMALATWPGSSSVRYQA